MSKKNLLGNIIGAPKTDAGGNNSKVANNNLETDKDTSKETNGGGETPTVSNKIETPKKTATEDKKPIVHEKPTEASIEKGKPIIAEKPEKTPIETEKPIVSSEPTETSIAKEALVMKHPIKKEPIENKSIRIAPEEMGYIDQLVTHKRMSGYTNYTKKEAISEALALLMDKYPVDKLLTAPYR